MASRNSRNSSRNNGRNAGRNTSRNTGRENPSTSQYPSEPRYYQGSDRVTFRRLDEPVDLRFAQEDRNGSTKRRSRSSQSGSRRNTGPTSSRRRPRRRLVHPERLIGFVVLLVLLVIILVTVGVHHSSTRNGSASSSDPVSSVVEVLPQQDSSQVTTTVKAVSTTTLDALPDQLAGYLGAVLNVNANNITTQQALANNESSITVGQVDMSQYRYVVAIDPGHGGRDKGETVGDTTEADIDLKVAKVMLDVLKEKYPDMYFFLTRDTDGTMTDSQRVNSVETMNADLVISIHVNSSDYEIGGTTASYWISPEEEESSDAAGGYQSERTQRCEALAGQLMQAAADGVGTWSRGEISLEEDDLLLQVDCPSVKVYLGFATYSLDNELLQNDENLTAAGNNLAQVVEQYVEQYAPEKTKGQSEDSGEESSADAGLDSSLESSAGQ